MGQRPGNTMPGTRVHFFSPREIHLYCVLRKYWSVTGWKWAKQNEKQQLSFHLRDSLRSTGLESAIHSASVGEGQTFLYSPGSSGWSNNQKYMRQISKRK